MKTSTAFQRSLLFQSLMGALAIAGTSLFPSEALAATRTWNATGSGVFNSNANWSSSTAPGTDDTAVFANASGGTPWTVSFNNSATVAELNFQNQAGSLEFDLSGGYSLTTTTWLRIGNGVNTSPNHVTFKNGTVHFNRLALSQSGNALIIDNASFTSAGDNQYFRINGSNNSAIIQNGGKVTINSGSTESQLGGAVSAAGNRLTITGAGSEFRISSANAFFTVGYLANADSNTLEIFNGGKFIDDGSKVVIGNRGANNNLFEISGAGSSYTGRNLIIGGDHAGAASSGNKLEVKTGAHAEISTLLTIGGNHSASTNNNVEVKGGSLEARAVEFGGKTGGNALTLTDGGTFKTTTNEALVVGNRANIASVNNVLSVSSNAELHVGTAGARGNLAIQKGSLVVNGGKVFAETLILEAADSATASIDFQAGELELASASVHTAQTIGSATGSTEAIYRMTNSSGTHTFANGLSLEKNARLAGSGTLDAAVTVVGAGVTVEVGSDAGMGLMMIQSSWVNTNAILELGIGDLSSGTPTAGTHFDQLLFTGHFTLGGTLNLDLSNWVAPTASQDFKLIGWDAYSGALEEMQINISIPNLLSYRLENDGFYVTTIPEAGTVWSLMIGLTLLAGARFRCRGKEA